MAHKVHPGAYRLKDIADWKSRGFYRNLPSYLEEDFRIRKFLLKKLANAGVEKIEIERFPGKINIIIFTARPGIIIGRGGEGAEQLRKTIIGKILKKKTNLAEARIASEAKEIEIETKKGDKKEKSAPEQKEKQEIRIEIREIRNPWVSANLVAQSIAQQFEKRIPFRRVLKQALGKASANKEVQGVRLEVSGRLDGAEIARREWMKSGRLPLQTLRADIDYARYEARCTYGTIGIKVWIYKGEKFEKKNKENK